MFDRHNISKFIVSAVVTVIILSAIWIPYTEIVKKRTRKYNRQLTEYNLKNTPATKT